MGINGDSSEEDVTPVGNRLLKVLARKNVCLISRSAHLSSALHWVKPKAQELVKPSCLSNGCSFAPNTHPSIDTKAVGGRSRRICVPEKSQIHVQGVDQHLGLRGEHQCSDLRAIKEQMKEIARIRKEILGLLCCKECFR